jgi:hypothetical protein
LIRKLSIKNLRMRKKKKKMMMNRIIKKRKTIKEKHKMKKPTKIRKLLSKMIR